MKLHLIILLIITSVVLSSSKKGHKNKNKNIKSDEIDLGEEIDELEEEPKKNNEKQHKNKKKKTKRNKQKGKKKNQNKKKHYDWKNVATVRRIRLEPNDYIRATKIYNFAKTNVSIPDTSRTHRVCPCPRPGCAAS